MPTIAAVKPVQGRGVARYRHEAENRAVFREQGVDQSLIGSEKHGKVIPVAPQIDGFKQPIAQVMPGDLAINLSLLLILFTP